MSDERTIIHVINSDCDSNHAAKERLRKTSETLFVSIDFLVKEELKKRGFETTRIVWWDFERRLSVEVKRENA